MKRLITSICAVICCLQIQAQDITHQTFKDTRIINMQSTEMIRPGYMDFRVAHRFGDLAGDAGGWPTFYGLESASDISIGFDFGITQKLNVGIHRMKGNGPLRQNVQGLVKLKLIEQQNGGTTPFSMVVLGMTSISTMQSSTGPNSLSNFDNFLHRVSYHVQILASKKFTDRLAIQGTAGWTFRNRVINGDSNDLVSVGGAIKYQINKALGFIVETTVPISSFRTTENGYYFPLGVGLEWETGGGHVFQINVTNAKGLSETDYIPYTQSNWGDGEVRLGFTISRQFKL